MKLPATQGGLKLGNACSASPSLFCFRKSCVLRADTSFLIGNVASLPGEEHLLLHLSGEVLTSTSASSWRSLIHIPDREYPEIRAWSPLAVFVPCSIPRTGRCSANA